MAILYVGPPSMTQTSCGVHNTAPRYRGRKKKKKQKTKKAEIYSSALHKQTVRSENLGSLGANPTVQLEKFNAVVLLNC